MKKLLYKIQADVHDNLQTINNAIYFVVADTIIEAFEKTTKTIKEDGFNRSDIKKIEIFERNVII